MGEHPRCEPCPLGKEVSRAELLKGGIFDVADDNLDHRAAALKLIRLNSGSAHIR